MDIPQMIAQLFQCGEPLTAIFAALVRVIVLDVIREAFLTVEDVAAEVARIFVDSPEIR